jgi:glucan biosynthesis protein C
LLEVLCTFFLLFFSKQKIIIKSFDRTREGYLLSDVPIQAEQRNAKDRLLYIDNLRLLIIVFVVMQHLAVTYSGIGSWYYYENTHLDTISTISFGFYLTFQQGYFMGVLFLIAGFFEARSYDRKGFGKFTKDRFTRLVIPTLIYMVAITPLIEYVELGNKWTGFDVIGFLSGTGVMWFTVALFAFSLVYGLFRLSRRSNPASDGRQVTFSFSLAVILIIIISVCAFSIRIVQPIGTSILNMQLCFFASYIILFIVGILAYRSNMFDRISYRTGKRWFVGGIVLGFIFWLALMIAFTISGSLTAFYGGLTWQSAGYSLWESFVAVAMSIGLIVVFRERFNRQSKIMSKLAENSFAVYMFHPLIIIGITVAFSGVVLYPLGKWLLLCCICIPVCFAATYFIFRRIPLLKKLI